MRRIDVSLLILIGLGITTGIVFAQTLAQQQSQGAQNKIDEDLVRINQITQDEDSLNSQYHSALADKESQKQSLNEEVFLLNSYLNPLPVETPTNMDIQGTVAPIALEANNDKHCRIEYGVKVCQQWES